MSAACYHGRRARGMKVRNEAMIERRWKTLLISVVLLMPGLGISPDLAAETREEKVDDVVLRVPTAWKKESPKSKMRALQFSIPPVSEDSRPAELAVFNFRGGGTVNQNIERWIGQFDPQGRQTEIFAGTIDGGRYWLADISGTYNQSVGPPILRKTESRPGSRVLAAIVVTKAGKVLYLKLAGPDKTVAGEAQRMREMFGADTASEKPYTLGS